MFERALVLPASGTETFFLWGPRQTGKSTLLRATYPDALWLDLLRSEQFRRYTERPESLREEVTLLPRGTQVVIDEVQKIPALLDEVHWLHENRGTRFALCGSSARKVRRGGANLLGGRAIRYHLLGLTARELGSSFDLDRLLDVGFLPAMVQSTRARRMLDAYVGDYLQQEIAAEGLVRRLPTFAEFLRVAALSDAEIVNFSSIARETGVSMPTVRSYFEILEDTLLGRFLPAFRRRPKRRTVAAPRFYFADVGVANVLAKRGRVQRGSSAYGKAFESWVFHELSAFDAYAETMAGLAYWRLTTGIEVDFIVGDMDAAIEAKASVRVTSDHLTGLRELGRDFPGVRRFVVALESRSRVTEDGIVILTVAEFLRRLYSGELVRSG